MGRVPSIRIRQVNDEPVNGGGDFVLYWMTACRRARWNFSLQRAVDWAVELSKPLVVLEALRCDYPWASERLHSFILNGMEDSRKLFEGTPALYYPFVERESGEGKGLVESLGARACVVIADEFPILFLPRMLRSAGRKLAVKLEAVDSNGLLPLGAADRVFLTAFSFRRFLQGHLPDHLRDFPEENPVSRLSPTLAKADLPEPILERWPAAPDALLNAEPDALSRLPLDHRVAAVEARGGSLAAEGRLRVFLRERLHTYHEARNHPDEDAVSGLSPFLHFGHISTHQIFSELAEEEEWTPACLAAGASGKRAGWWGMGEGAEAFLDQVVTWREIGFNMCSRREDYDRFDSLPGWATAELLQHAADPRPYVYSLDGFEDAGTHDPLWNAAQVQLLEEGRIHNYLRMLWGKKILHWSSSPREALAVMIELNNKYGLDGRDPNSYTGIFWILGRYDRPWGPTRPVFGKIRYMSSRSTRRKVRVEEYLHRYTS